MRTGGAITDKDVLIIVMGLTGSGKSTLINLACQSEKKLRVGHDVWSCTDTVEAAPPFELAGRRVRLFDTPGFDDTNKTETEILRIIAIELEKQFRQKITLHGIIYLHRISDMRVGSLAKSNFGLFRKLCGDTSLKNVVIVTNMWSKVTEKEGMGRVVQLTSLDDFFKPALEKKARIMHHRRDTVESIHGIIRTIIENHPMPLIIQEELVNQGKNINQTGAGQEVDKRITALTAEYEKKIKEQIAAAEEARRLHDEETRKEQLEEKAKNEEKLRHLREESAKHTERYIALQKEFEANRKKAEDERLKLERLEAEMRARNLQAPQPPSPPVRNSRPEQVQHRPATFGSITSGMNHTVWNVKCELYATMSRHGNNIVPRSDLGGSTRQQWVFDQVDRYWTITSASSGLYMSLDRNGNLYGRSTVQYWDIEAVDDYTNRFQLYAVGRDGYVLGYGSGQSCKFCIYEGRMVHRHLARMWEIMEDI